jgi:hypothetical protein
LAPRIFPYLYFDFTHPLDAPEDPPEETLAILP